MPKHIHSLDTFWGASLASPFWQELLEYSQPGQIFEKGLSAGPVWYNILEHSYMLDTVYQLVQRMFKTHSQPGEILRKVYQLVQFDRKYQDTLTAWTHFKGRLSASSVCQQMPEQTHSLDILREDY